MKYAVETTFDWDSFVERHWDAHPVLYKGGCARPFDVSTAFEAAANAGRSLRDVRHSLDEVPTVNVSADGLVSVKSRRWIPRRSDGSFSGYHARVAGHRVSAHYALIVNSLHSYSFPLWSHARAFFSDLWLRVGLPLTGAITTLFHGNYEHTPVGVHKDRFSTFLFALSGKKRMRFWRQKPWSEPVSTILDYQAHLDTSFVVEVEPGDALYWPWTYFHVGESAGGGVATSVNVGIPKDEHSARYDIDEFFIDGDGVTSFADTDRAIAHAFDDIGVPALAKDIFDSAATLSTDLPPCLRQVVSAFRESGQHTEARLRATSARRRSAAGFYPVPKAATCRTGLAPADRIRGDLAHPILLSDAPGGGCFCAANGHSVRTALSTAMLSRRIDALNAGRIVRMRALLDGCTQDEAAEMRRLLEALRRARAVKRLVRN